MTVSLISKSHLITIYLNVSKITFNNNNLLLIGNPMSEYIHGTIFPECIMNKSIDLNEVDTYYIC